MKKPTLQKNTLLKNAQVYAESNFFKRVFFSPPQEEIQIIFFPTLRFFNYLFSKHTLRNLTGSYSNVNRFLKSVCKLDTTYFRADRRASANSGFAKKRVQWLIEHSASHQILWCIDSLVLRNPLLRKAAKRYV